MRFRRAVLVAVLLGAVAISWGSRTASSQAAEEFVGEGGVIPDAPPFKVPVKYAGTFGHDEGVVFASGEALKRVPHPPGAREYSVTAGIYVFNAADRGKGILISYTFTPPAGRR